MPVRNPQPADQDKSWGDAIRRYVTEKHIVLPSSAKLPRAYRDPNFDNRAEEAAYNILTHTYIKDPSRTEQLKQREKLMRQATLELHRQRTKFGVDHFNEPPPEPKAARTRFVPEYDEAYEGGWARDYDIVTNFPPLRRTKVTEFYKEPDPEYIPSSNRDYDILTNRTARHEDRLAEEKQRALEYAEKKYFYTHHYNPLTATFYDPKTDQAFMAAKKKHDVNRSYVAEAIIPPRVRESEGFLYDLVSMKPKNKDLLKEVEGRKHHKLRGRTKRAFEAKQVVNGEKAFHIMDQRHLNRVSWLRNKPAIDRGYQLITNRDYVGTDTSKYRVVPGLDEPIVGMKELQLRRYTAPLKLTVKADGTVVREGGKVALAKTVRMRSSSAQGTRPTAVPVAL